MTPFNYHPDDHFPLLENADLAAWFSQSLCSAFPRSVIHYLSWFRSGGLSHGFCYCPAIGGVGAKALRSKASTAARRILLTHFTFTAHKHTCQTRPQSRLTLSLTRTGFLVPARPEPPVFMEIFPTAGVLSEGRNGSVERKTSPSCTTKLFFED